MTAVGPRPTDSLLAVRARDRPIGLGVWDISTPPNSPHLVHSVMTQRDFFSVQNIHFETRDKPTNVVCPPPESPTSSENGHFFLEATRPSRISEKALSSPTPKCDYIWLRGAKMSDRATGGECAFLKAFHRGRERSPRCRRWKWTWGRWTRKSLINISICSC